jgi:drug/metabolite transporter (DMT)-like permease
MIAFAGNSLLCRLALKDAHVDAVTFTSVRLLSGALALWLLVRIRGTLPRTAGSWTSAFSLFAYAIGFSLAYLALPAGTGALLLFGAVQATMIGYGLRSGERLRPLQTLGYVAALVGLVVLVAPGVTAPPIASSGSMLLAGVAWGVYSIRGRSSGDPTTTTTANFLRAVPFALALSVALVARSRLDSIGLACAVASGAVASGLGYAVWYTALKGLRTTQAATVQLSAPLLAAFGGIAFLGERFSLRVVVASVAILGGIALAIRGARREREPRPVQANE